MTFNRIVFPGLMTVTFSSKAGTSLRYHKVAIVAGLKVQQAQPCAGILAALRDDKAALTRFLIGGEVGRDFCPSWQQQNPN
jgi:hypothetical protein